MRRLLFVAALVSHTGFGSAQSTSATDGTLNVSITLEDASHPRAAVANLALPIEQESRSLTVPPEQERRFEPADFARPNRLESLPIAAPDLPRGITAVAVRCQAFIGADGALGEYHCLNDETRRYERVVSAVIAAVPEQRFVAARVDGEAVRVLMNFAVYIACSSGSCVAVTARNHGHQIETWGLDYVDPQPILERDEWYEGFDYKLRWARAWMPRARDIQWPLPFVMAVEVDANGVAGQGCVYWLGITRSIAPLLDLGTLRALESAVESFGDARFVPGMIGGAPTRMRLYEQTVTQWVQPPDGKGSRAGRLACK
jgi:hypothetical protein